MNRLPKLMKTAYLLVMLFGLASFSASAQDLDFKAIRADVDFGKKLQPWDGFGFNYVETPQTKNYTESPQDYGGFSILKDEDRQKIIDMVFGDDGLRVGLLKMFLDPFHQAEPGGKFNGETTAKWELYFAQEGLKKTRADGRDLAIITTLHGPPAYITKENVIRGRDLDPAHKQDLANYYVDWVKFLRAKEGLPVKYVSLHNEGEDWVRWNQAGLTTNPGHDYNLFFPPEQVVEFIKLVSDGLNAAGLKGVGVTPGETTGWYRFYDWGYADAIADDPEALSKLGLITSHGFYTGNVGRWFNDYESAGIDLLRAKRPDLHAWDTSTSWGQMDAKNIMEHRNEVYAAKVNGIILWSGIHRPSIWVGGDPNPGSAFNVNDDGTWEVRRGYYFYKQLTRAGQPGMVVARTSAMDSEVAMLAFASNGTKNPDAFVLVNIGETKKVNVHITGTAARSFAAFGTTNDEKERYSNLGEFPVKDGALQFEAPSGSVTTFFALP